MFYHIHKSKQTVAFKMLKEFSGVTLRVINIFGLTLPF